jgi:Tol biopolymer transport system component
VQAAVASASTKIILFCHTEHPFDPSGNRPLQRGEKLECEAGRVFPWRQRVWLWIWLGWFALGLALALRSWRATDLNPIRHHPAPECSPCLSGDGRRVAYEVTRPNSDYQDICVYDLDSGQTRILGRDKNESSQQPRLDKVGRQLVFASFASDWVADDANSVSDIFLYDLQTDQVERLLPPRPVPGLSSSYRPSLAADGRQVAFLSYGVPDSGSVRGRNVCLWSRTPDGSQVRVIPDTFRGRGPVLGAASFSPGGNRLAFSAFSYDLLPQLRPIQYDLYLVRLHPSAPWPPAEPSIPERMAQGLGQVTKWAWDSPRLRPLWPVALLSHQPDGGPANANSLEPVLLEEECIFTSLADNLVAGDHNDCHDIFVRPLTGSGRIERLTPAANDSSFEPAASSDGRWVVFTSYASDLVEGDRNGTSDVFLLDRRSRRLQCLSLGGDAPSHSPTISEDGGRIVFVSEASNLADEPGGRCYLWVRGQPLRRLP